MVTTTQAIVALLAFEEEMHGKAGTLAERVAAMQKALEIGVENRPLPAPPFRPDWERRA